MSNVFVSYLPEILDLSFAQRLVRTNANMTTALITIHDAIFQLLPTSRRFFELVTVGR